MLVLSVVLSLTFFLLLISTSKAKNADVKRTKREDLNQYKFNHFEEIKKFFDSQRNVFKVDRKTNSCDFLSNLAKTDNPVAVVENRPSTIRFSLKDFDLFDGPVIGSGKRAQRLLNLKDTLKSKAASPRTLKTLALLSKQHELSRRLTNLFENVNGKTNLANDSAEVTDQPGDKYMATHFLKDNIEPPSFEAFKPSWFLKGKGARESITSTSATMNINSTASNSCGDSTIANKLVENLASAYYTGVDNTTGRGEQNRISVERSPSSGFDRQNLSILEELRPLDKAADFILQESNSADKIGRTMRSQNCDKIPEEISHSNSTLEKFKPNDYEKLIECKSKSFDKHGRTSKRSQKFDQSQLNITEGIAHSSKSLNGLINSTPISSDDHETKLKARACNARKALRKKYASLKKQNSERWKKKGKMPVIGTKKYKENFHDFQSKDYEITDLATLDNRADDADDEDIPYEENAPEEKNDNMGRIEREYLQRGSKGQEHKQIEHSKMHKIHSNLDKIVADHRNTLDRMLACEKEALDKDIAEHNGITTGKTESKNVENFSQLESVRKATLDKLSTENPKSVFLLVPCDKVQKQHFQMFKITIPEENFQTITKAHHGISNPNHDNILKLNRGNILNSYRDRSTSMYPNSDYDVMPYQGNIFHPNHNISVHPFCKGCTSSPYKRINGDSLNSVVCRHVLSNHTQSDLTLNEVLTHLSKGLQVSDRHTKLSWNPSVNHTPTKPGEIKAKYSKTQLMEDILKHLKEVVEKLDSMLQRKGALSTGKSKTSEEDNYGRYCNGERKMKSDDERIKELTGSWEKNHHKERNEDMHVENKGRYYGCSECGKENKRRSNTPSRIVEVPEKQREYESVDIWPHKVSNYVDTMKPKIPTHEDQRRLKEPITDEEGLEKSTRMYELGHGSCEDEVRLKVPISSSSSDEQRHQIGEKKKEYKITASHNRERHKILETSTSIHGEIMRYDSNPYVKVDEASILDRKTFKAPTRPTTKQIKQSLPFDRESMVECTEIMKMLERVLENENSKKYRGISTHNGRNDRKYHRIEESTERLKHKKREKQKFYDDCYDALVLLESYLNARKVELKRSRSKNTRGVKNRDTTKLSKNTNMNSRPMENADIITGRIKNSSKTGRSSNTNMNSKNTDINTGSIKNSSKTGRSSNTNTKGMKDRDKRTGGTKKTNRSNTNRPRPIKHSGKVTSVNNAKKKHPQRNTRQVFRTKKELRENVQYCKILGMNITDKKNEAFPLELKRFTTDGNFPTTTQETENMTIYKVNNNTSIGIVSFDPHRFNAETTPHTESNVSNIRTKLSLKSPEIAEKMFCKCSNNDRASASFNRDIQRDKHIEMSNNKPEYDNEKNQEDTSNQCVDSVEGERIVSSSENFKDHLKRYKSQLIGNLHVQIDEPFGNIDHQCDAGINHRINADTKECTELNNKRRSMIEENLKDLRVRTSAVISDVSQSNCCCRRSSSFTQNTKEPNAKTLKTCEQKSRPSSNEEHEGTNDVKAVITDSFPKSKDFMLISDKLLTPRSSQKVPHWLDKPVNRYLHETRSFVDKIAPTFQLADHGVISRLVNESKARDKEVVKINGLYYYPADYYEYEYMDAEPDQTRRRNEQIKESHVEDVRNENRGEESEVNNNNPMANYDVLEKCSNANGRDNNKDMRDQGRTVENMNNKIDQYHLQLKNANRDGSKIMLNFTKILHIYSPQEKKFKTVSKRGRPNTLNRFVKTDINDGFGSKDVEIVTNRRRQMERGLGNEMDESRKNIEEEGEKVDHVCKWETTPGLALLEKTSNIDQRETYLKSIPSERNKEVADENDYPETVENKHFKAQSCQKDVKAKQNQKETGIGLQRCQKCFKDKQRQILPKVNNEIQKCPKCFKNKSYRMKTNSEPVHPIQMNVGKCHNCFRNKPIQQQLSHDLSDFVSENFLRKPNVPQNFDWMKHNLEFNGFDPLPIRTAHVRDISEFRDDDVFLQKPSKKKLLVKQWKMSVNANGSYNRTHPENTNVVDELAEVNSKGRHETTNFHTIPPLTADEDNDAQEVNSQNVKIPAVLPLKPWIKSVQDKAITDKRSKCAPKVQKYQKKKTNETHMKISIFNITLNKLPGQTSDLQKQTMKSYTDEVSLKYPAERKYSHLGDTRFPIPTKSNSEETRVHGNKEDDPWNFLHDDKPLQNSESDRNTNVHRNNDNELVDLEIKFGVKNNFNYQNATKSLDSHLQDIGVQFPLKKFTTLSRLTLSNLNSTQKVPLINWSEPCRLPPLDNGSVTTGTNTMDSARLKRLLDKIKDEFYKFNVTDSDTSRQNHTTDSHNIGEKHVMLTNNGGTLMNSGPSRQKHGMGSDTSRENDVMLSDTDDSRQKCLTHKDNERQCLDTGSSNQKNLMRIFNKRREMLCASKKLKLSRAVLNKLLKEIYRTINTEPNKHNII